MSTPAPTQIPWWEELLIMLLGQFVPAAAPFVQAAVSVQKGGTGTVTVPSTGGQTIQVSAAQNPTTGVLEWDIQSHG